MRSMALERDRAAAPALAPVPLSEVLDRLLGVGVVLLGDATISVAGVDLVYLGLEAVLASTATLRRSRTLGARPRRGRRRRIDARPSDPGGGRP